jgi:hypothetical protein
MMACALVLRAGTAAGQTAPLTPERWPAATPAVAAEPTAPAPPPATRWYGWQTLLADFGALALTVGLGASVDEHNDAAVAAAVVTGVSGFVLGGPIVHAAHGHWQKAGGSFALRGGLMLLGGLVGWGLGADACSQYVYDHEGCALGYAAVGLVAGAAASIIVDASFLAREPVPTTAPRPTQFVFAPTRGGGGLSLIGHF